jgi:hypothetical protein
VDANHPVAQYFRPTLPANAVSWAVTRVQLLVQSDGPIAGTYTVQVASPDGTDFPATVVDSQTGLESVLTSSATWQSFSFANATGLSPMAGACIVVSSVGATGPACNVQSHHSGVISNGTREISGNGGSSWNDAPGVLNHYIYGTYVTPGPSPTLYYLTNVRATLRTSPDTGATARVTMRVLNEPQVTGP